MSKRAEIRERRRKERQKRRLISISLVVGVALIFTAILIWPNFAPIGDIAIPDSREFPMIEGVALGAPDAPVVIENYSDFQCSFCRLFHQTTLNQIVDTYVATGQVRIVFRQFPRLGQESVNASNASLCAAEQGKFWEYAEILFANQTGVEARNFTSRRLLAYAETIGLDADQFSSCLREERYNADIGADLQKGIEAGVTSTPSFLINGELLVGAQPFEQFQALIDAALEQASGSTNQ